MFSIVCLGGLFLDGGPVAAEEDVAKIDFTQMAKLPVVLKDESGHPVTGAEVMPYAMRMKEEQGHGFWNREVLGPPKAATSDENGVAEIEYPIHVKSGPRVLTTRLVTFQIKHTDYVQKVVHFDLGPERAEVTLKAGCEVQISAVDEKSGLAIDEFGVVMAGPAGSDMWAAAKPGGRRTRSIDDGTWQTMLVKLQDDGPTLFSGVFPLRVRPKQTVILRNLPLKPGAVLRGQLSDNVSRPVTGYVVACSVPMPAEDSWDEKNPSLIWHDWVEVAKDGTFVFESLPHGGQVQLIGVCEGWISTTSVPDAGPFVMGQLFDVDDEIVNVELAMEATGTLEVKVLTPEGEPLTEGSVTSWPNQRYFKGGSTVVGQRFRSSTQVRNQLLPADKRAEFVDVDLKFPFQKSLNKDGVAILTGIPIGRQSLYLAHERLAFATAEERGIVRFQLPSTKPVKMRLKTVVEEK